MNLTPIIEDIRAWAKTKPLIRKVWIFGSRVRDDYKPDSDLDIAVELDRELYRGTDESGGIATWMFETEGWRDELQLHCPHIIQLEQFIRDQTPTIANALKRSSQLVYEKTV